LTSVSTHVLDTARGLPASGIGVTLEAADGDGWRRLGAGTTDADGRVRDLAGPDGAADGMHRLVFDVADHHGPDGFFGEVVVAFRVAGQDHLHVPLLLSPYAYSVYRGS